MGPQRLISGCEEMTIHPPSLLPQLAATMFSQLGRGICILNSSFPQSYITSTLHQYTARRSELLPWYFTTCQQQAHAGIILTLKRNTCLVSIT